MCLEAETWSLAVGGVASGIVDDGIRRTDGELFAYSAVERWYRVGPSGGEAVWVAKIAAFIGRRGPIKVAEEVQFFGRVVLMDVLVETGYFVGTVLDGVDASSRRLFIDTDIIPQTPSHQ